VRSAFDLFQDVASSGSPDEWFGTFVVAVDVGADGHDEFFEVAENRTAEPILGEVTKEPFHHIEPRGAGGSEVQMKARVARQPALHFGVLMGGVVIADQVQLPVGGDGLVDQAEKLEPFLVAIALLTRTDKQRAGEDRLEKEM